MIVFVRFKHISLFSVVKYIYSFFFHRLQNYNLFCNNSKKKAMSHCRIYDAGIHICTKCVWLQRNLMLNLLSLSFVSHCAPCNPWLFRMCTQRLPWLHFSQVGRTTDTLNMPLWLTATQHSYSAHTSVILLDIHTHTVHSVYINVCVCVAAAWKWS